MITEYPEDIRRGEPFEIRGRLSAGGQALGDRDVKVVIGSPSEASSSGRVLARVKTDRAGEFEVEVSLPEEFEIGLWSLYAVFDGDRTYRSARSR